MKWCCCVVSCILLKFQYYKLRSISTTGSSISRLHIFVEYFRTMYYDHTTGLGIQHCSGSSHDCSTSEPAARVTDSIVENFQG